MNTTLGQTKRVWTEADVASLPDDGYSYELVSGELVVTPKNSLRHAEICVRAAVAIHRGVHPRKLGVICDSSTGFWMQNGNCRSPDVSFISKARLLGKKRAESKFFVGAADLAIEVLAPHNTAAEITARLKDFFASGTKLAWIINPEEECAEVCHSPTGRRLVGPGGMLDGEDLLSGFQLSLGELFAEWEW